MRTLLVVLALLLAGCGGCTGPYVPPPPVPPTPPVPPDPAPPEVFVDRATMEAFQPGMAADALSELPEPSDVVKVGDKTIYVWLTNEPRPDGGFVHWEVHVKDGLITLSGDF